MVLDGAAVLADGVVEPRRLSRVRRVGTLGGAGVVVVVVVVVVVGVVVSTTVVGAGDSVSGVSVSSELGELSKEDICTERTVVGSGLLVSSVATVVERTLSTGASELGSSVGREVERERTIEVYWGCVDISLSNAVSWSSTSSSEFWYLERIFFD